MFLAGWTGECSVHEAIRNTYILAADEPDTKEPKMPTPVMQSPLKLTELVDWGVIPTMIEGRSRTPRASCCHKGRKGGRNAGWWVCTPGKWNCHVTRDEFCHFLEGAAPMCTDPAR